MVNVFVSDLETGRYRNGGALGQDEFLDFMEQQTVFEAVVARRRSQEFAIRMALGATEDSVVRAVVRSGAVLLGAGIVIGLAASRVTNELLLSNVVLGSSETDSTLSVVAAVAVIAVVGLAACLIPARRASRISPMKALRQD
jgi:putative ABC transport system permease protein